MNQDPAYPPWAMNLEDFLKRASVEPKVGLHESEAKVRLLKYGPNQIKSEKKISILTRFYAQFKSPVVIILIVATLISFLLGEYVDATAISMIVVINALIGFFQEMKAEAAVEALKKMSAPKGRVLRGGQIHEVPAIEIVLGDVIFLESGDFVPADARIIEGHQLSADEAVLTGESLPVNKNVQAVNQDVAVADRKNMLFAGTAVATGSAKAVVTSTGSHTEIGRIANLLEAAGKNTTPLQLRLEQVSKKLLVACGVVVVLVALLGVYHQEAWLDIVMTAISLSVAAIPEGLPTVVTLALALAVRRMSRKNAIVKHLPAVETLGSTSVICTDKTGTLTTGQMRVREIFTFQSGLIEQEKGGSEIESLILSSVLGSNAAPNATGEFSGDPTEVALLILAQGHGVDIRKSTTDFPRIYEWSFDSDRKRMSVANRHQNRILIHSKGAPESILPLCNLSAPENEQVHQVLEQLSAQGRRVLAVALKEVSKESDGIGSLKETLWRDVENNLTFLGLVSIADPPRDESIQAIADCHAAGIQVVMITGDHPSTAQAIAKELGILRSNFNGVISGAELERMTESELKSRVDKIAVYARVSPEHKLKIVRAWQSLGHVVAMTGDGVNDAPALKQATIGVSMGRGGTEVARQASSMILTDDNFATIVSAVEEGRAIYGNIRRTIQYLLSGNLAEILIMLGAAIAGWPAPLAPIHLLWINLVTDGLPSLALAAEPVPKGFLKTTQKPSADNFFSRAFNRELIFIGLVISLLSLFIYGYSLQHEGEAMARTHVFSFLVFAELFRSFACRSETKTFFEMGLFSNLYHLGAVAIPMIFQISLHHLPVFQTVFKVHAIGWSECIYLILLTLVPVTFLEIRKLLIARKGQRAA